MKVKVRFYAIYRDKLGKEKIYDLPEGAKVRDLLEILKDELGELYEVAEPVIIIKGRFAEPEEELTEVVDVVPPAAGGKPKVIVTKDDYSVDDVVNSILSEDVGAVVTFVGFVKSKGGKVKELVYEAHEDLEKFIEKHIDDVIKKYNLKDAMVVQFIGPRKVGEKTLIVATAAEGREEAFKGARELLERLKHEVPIWKLERRVDGEYWLIGEKEEVKRL
ncbi:molybdenum cofactor biosynthesis protein MoaD [Ignicoccus pacificus DSM 13166]|uniref:Molybdenum cofactor biosynthesis protein MoaD n=1 Tax=Ignicoccus pacificus DSM 13166 TaxID=940294 RepID=A0A977K9L3_9CREN|nr:molybdenum cofactor biosynthesis protein MoaD [Ignicoccus pacificus DSM 13166]